MTAGITCTLCVASAMTPRLLIDSPSTNRWSHKLYMKKPQHNYRIFATFLCGHRAWSFTLISEWPPQPPALPSPCNKSPPPHIPLRTKCTCGRKMDIFLNRHFVILGGAPPLSRGQLQSDKIIDKLDSRGWLRRKHFSKESDSECPLVNEPI